MTLAPPLERFRAFARDSGLSQAELAKLVGCSQPQIARILKGSRRMGLDVAASLERITDGQIRAVEWAERKAS